MACDAASASSPRSTEGALGYVPQDLAIWPQLGALAAFAVVLIALAAWRLRRVLSA